MFGKISELQLVKIENGLVTSMYHIREFIRCEALRWKVDSETTWPLIVGKDLKVCLLFAFLEDTWIICCCVFRTSLCRQMMQTVV